MADGPRTVLVIEDDADFLPLVRMMLDIDGVRVVTAATGQEGLDLLRAAPPDAVILDLMLPDIHGWEVFRRMRAEPSSASIPVIILSVMGSRHDREVGREMLGVYAYLVKPCLPSQLRQTVLAALAA